MITAVLLLMLGLLNFF
ncbi:MAG: hypothetical protein K2K32_00660 [Muribaculaceae bacterium]|nr:hypothetical protein [Muribaculaceae bacterium]